MTETGMLAVVVAILAVLFVAAIVLGRSGRLALPPPPSGRPAAGPRIAGPAIMSAPNVAWSRPYAPAEGRAMAAIALLAARAALAALALVAAVVAAAAPRVAQSVAFAAGAAELQIALVVCWVVESIAVPVWMHRAYRNLFALGAWDLQWSPAWAAGAWFIPVGNLVVPYLITRELSRGVSTGPERLRALLPTWWTLRLLSWALVVFVLASHSAPARGPVAVLSSVILIAAECLQIAIVRRITRGERAWHDRLTT